MDDLLPTFVSRYQLPTFPLPLFVSELKDSDLLPRFVSKYQLPLFVSGLEEPLNFADDFTTTPEVNYQSLKALTYVKSHNIRLNDKLFELGNRKTDNKATTRANQKRTKKRKGRKHVNKLNVTTTEHKMTNTSSEESQDNEIADYFSNFMAQADTSLQAEVEKIRNDDFDC